MLFGQVDSQKRFSLILLCINNFPPLIRLVWFLIWLISMSFEDQKCDICSEKQGVGLGHSSMNSISVCYLVTVSSILM